MYIFVAYKPTSYFSYSGCSSETFDSDHVVIIDLNYDGLVNVYGEYLYKNNLILHEENGREEGYKFWIFKDGQLLESLEVLKSDAEVVSEQLLKKHLQEKLLEIRKRLEKEEAEKKERRRLQFEKLKEEFL